MSDQPTRWAELLAFVGEYLDPIEWVSTDFTSSMATSRYAMRALAPGLVGSSFSAHSSLEIGVHSSAPGCGLFARADRAKRRKATRAPHATLG